MLEHLKENKLVILSALAASIAGFGFYYLTKGEEKVLKEIEKN